MDTDAIVEGGLVILAGALAVGIGVLIAGRVGSEAKRRQCHAERPPAPGDVPDQRHQSIATVSAR